MLTFKIQQLPGNLATLTTGIILLGTFNLHSKYEHYGIPIFNYLEVSEILFSFTDVFPAVLIIVLFQLLATVLVDRLVPLPKLNLDMDFDVEKALDLKTKSKEEVLNNVRRLADELKKVTYSKLYGKWYVIGWLVFIVLYNIIFFFDLFRSYNNSFYFDFHAISLAFWNAYTITLLFYFGATVYQPESLSFPREKTLLIFFIAGIVGYLLLRNDLSYQYNSNYRAKYNVSILLEGGKQITSDDTTMYIGSTKSWLFFRNKTTSENSVIPISEIKKIEIKKMRDGL